MPERPLSVLVVDDDFYAREAIRLLLSKDARTRVSGAVSTPDEAVAALETTDVRMLPAVILLDVRFGRNDTAGIEALPAIRAASSESKVLVTSVDREEDVVMEAIAAGADGYVWKNESAEGIANAVVAVAEGRFVVTRSVADALLGKTIELRAYATEVMKGDDRYRDLTEALRKTIYLFCFCGMSKEEIAEELCVSPNTVASRVKVAYQVLGAGTRQEAFQALVEREGNER